MIKLVHINLYFAIMKSSYVTYRGIIMGKTNVETLFEWFEQTTDIVQHHVKEPYLDSLAIAMETLFYEKPSADLDDILSHKLKANLKNLQSFTYNKEDIRKAVQLAILKGMSKTTQQQHLMTPETVALLVGYISEKLMANQTKIRIFDPVVGTANLLTTVIGQLNQEVEAYASEVDPTLIQLALLNANLQKMKVELFHQDTLQPLLLDPVDLIVADLPVGYYPDDVRANEFELKAEKGHSYSHHLLLEQSMNYTKEGGYLTLIVPEFLFDSDQSEQLLSYIQKNAHIIGILQLPESAFKSKKNKKSILILQKQGDNTSMLKQPLFAQLPSFKDTLAMEDILEQMNAWFAKKFS